MRQNPYRNRSVQLRVNNKEWLDCFWDWLADGWGYMGESERLHVEEVIEQSEDAPDCTELAKAEIIRAAMITMARDPDYPIKRVKRGQYVFVDYDVDEGWMK